MTGSTSNQNAGTGTESTPSNLNNADGWKGQSMQYRCECEFCKTGKATTHNDPSHDQSLYQKLDLSPAQDPALLQLTVFGGTTKCARIISKFLEEGEGFGRAYFENKKVVEVGSGTGLVGIVLGIIGANVVLTDQAPVLELLQENIEHNLNDPKFDREVCGKFDVHELYWGSSKVPEIVQNADVIIGSDLIFAKENIPLLLTTFETLCSPEKNTELIFAHIDRFSWEKSFFDGMTRNGFRIELIHTDVDIKIFRFIRISLPINE